MSTKTLVLFLSLSIASALAQNGPGERANSLSPAPSPVATRANDDDSGCVTQEGRAGTCVRTGSCQTVKDESDLPVCYTLPFFGTKYICCPSTDKPGVYPKMSSGCGVRPDIAPIVGGVDSVPNSWPWAVAVFQRSSRDPTKKQFICGGSIVNEQYVMTASHCIVRYEGKMKAEDFFVKVGGHDLKTSGEFYDVAEVKPHENYRVWRRYNDVALFRLAKKLDFSNPNVRPVCLPTPDMENRNFTGETVKVIGWGTTSFGGDIAPNLMEVDVPVVNNEECNNAYKSVEGSTVAYPEGINRNFVCAGSPEGGKDSCQGDSGGPLLYNLNGRWFQLGVVSFGYKCAEKGYPGVYTNVPNFLKWLGTHMEDVRKKGQRA